MSDELKPIAKYCVSQWDNPLDRGRYSDWNGVGEPFEVQIARAYLERLEADEAERKLSRDVRAEWMRHAGYQDQAETPQEVGTLSAEASELLAVLRIERLQDDADRIEREKPIDHEWFRRNGDDTSSIRIYVGGCEYEIEKDSGDGINLTVYLGGAMEFCTIPAISTVGQLLNLLRALGVKP